MNLSRYLCWKKETIPIFNKKQIYVGYLYLTKAKLHEILNTFEDLILWSRSKESFQDILFIGERMSYNYNLITHYKEYVVKQFINIYKKGSKFVVEIVSYQNVSHVVLIEINEVIKQFFLNRKIDLAPHEHKKKIRITNANLVINPTNYVYSEISKILKEYNREFIICMNRFTEKEIVKVILKKLAQIAYNILKESVMSNCKNIHLLPSILYFIYTIKNNSYPYLTLGTYNDLKVFLEHELEEKLKLIYIYLVDISTTKKGEDSDNDDNIMYYKVSLCFMKKNLF